MLDNFFKLSENGTDFKFQVYPTSSDIKFYGLRTYNFPFTYAQVQKNYISSMSKLSDKQAYYLDNDILYHLSSCYLLVALPIGYILSKR